MIKNILVKWCKNSYGEYTNCKIGCDWYLDPWDQEMKMKKITDFSLLEHMFFKGTETRSAREIAESFDSIGGQVNAFTSKEYTCYYAKVLDEHAKYALDVLADMFFNSTFDEEELKKRRMSYVKKLKCTKMLQMILCMIC